MFDEKFAEYVGSKSGSTYSAGLNYIETNYTVSIDDEYTKDKCTSLTKLLEQDKNTSNGSQEKRLYDVIAHLKRYVYYRDYEDAIARRAEFEKWMALQPQKNAPNKKYDPKTIYGAARRLEFKMDTLGIAKYIGVNCFTITDPVQFAELHRDCYGAAKASDAKEGHSDFRNGLDFYLKFLEEKNGGTAMTGNIDATQTVTDVSLNTILYGPPGTGKTYHTVKYAVAIIENKPLAEIEQEDHETVLARYNDYKNKGQIAFTTFHQSYGYEEFIEGIKPVITTDDEDARTDIQYAVTSGIFKDFCERSTRTQSIKNVTNYNFNNNPNIWKVSLGGSGDNPIRTDCLNNEHIRIGWDDYGKDITDENDFSKYGGKKPLNAFFNRMKLGDIVLSCYTSTSIDAIGVITGEYEWHNEYEHCKRVRNVNWIVKDINENIMDITNNTTMTASSVYRFPNVTLNDVLGIVKKYTPEEPETETVPQNYVFIIDEINRGNISKIFGELITLIEPSKRIGEKEEMTAILPYSAKPFGVPNNVYIIGTMNTADRSIATIDTALRRRFRFKEMLPDTKVLEKIEIEGISISKMLDTINRRITALYDREHTIGHAYFMPLKDSPTMDTLAKIFENNIIPLLQEYFYEDYEKIRLVLGDSKKKGTDHPQFIEATQTDYSDLFGSVDTGLDEGYTYKINASAFKDPNAYLNV